MGLRESAYARARKVLVGDKDPSCDFWRKPFLDLGLVELQERLDEYGGFSPGLRACADGLLDLDSGKVCKSNYAVAVEVLVYLRAQENGSLS
jgi:hypothetical protein